MNPLLKAREVAYYLTDSQAALALAASGVAGEAAEGAQRAGTDLVIIEPGELAATLGNHEPAPAIADRAPSDTAVILYTSGTTGQPKGAELTHDNLIRNIEVTSATLLRLRPEDVILGALPLFHSFGQVVGMGCAIASGACLTLLPRFDPGHALEIIKRDQVTVLPGVPTMYAAILHSAGGSAGDVASLRLCVSGGAAMPVELLRGFEKEFGCMILEGYGLSETSPVASFNHPDRARKPGTIGQAISGVDMRVQDDAGTPLPPGEVGEIAVRGHNVMKGYWGARRKPRRCCRGLVPHRRPGPGGRGGLLLDRRPQEGHDHPRWAQRLPARGRGGPLRAPGGRGGSRHRRPRRDARRGDRRGRHAQTGRVRQP